MPEMAGSRENSMPDSDAVYPERRTGTLQILRRFDAFSLRAQGLSRINAAKASLEQARYICCCRAYFFADNNAKAASCTMAQLNADACRSIKKDTLRLRQLPLCILPIQRNMGADIFYRNSTP